MGPASGCMAWVVRRVLRRHSTKATYRLAIFGAFSPVARLLASIKRLVGDDLLQAAILLFQLLEPPGFVHPHTTVLVAPLIERPLADAVLAAQVRNLRARLRQFQNLDDLLFAEPCLLHLVLQALCEPRF